MAKEKKALATQSNLCYDKSRAEQCEFYSHQHRRILLHRILRLLLKAAIFIWGKLIHIFKLTAEMVLAFIAHFPADHINGFVRIL